MGRPLPLPELLDGAGHQARDIELLRAAAPAVRIGVVTDLYLSLGVAQPDGAPCAVRARELGIPVLRRSSGGTAVLGRPGDLLWARVLPREDPGVGRDYVRAYGRLGAGATAFLRGLGATDVDWKEPSGISEELCLMSTRGRVLTCGGRTVGGAAQHRTSRALLHHGILMREVDPTLLAELFRIPEPIVRRQLVGLVEWAPEVPARQLALDLHHHLTGTGRPGPDRAGSDP
ncbi:MAG: lipoate--protein ligase family protein [Thermoplasmata archaeon]